MSKFSFEADFSLDVVFQGYHVWFKNNDMISTDVFRKDSNLSELSDTFKNSPEMLKYLTINKPVEHFPKIWKLGGSIQKLPRGKRHVGFYGKSYYWDEFPTEYVLNYPINQFRIYANNTDYFQSNLPNIWISTNDNATWSLNEPYFQMLIATWIATYACGISIQHLLFSPDIPKQITSLMRFHVYFTVRRIMRQMQTGDFSTISKSNYGFLKDHIPKWTWQEIQGYKNEHLGQDVIGSNPHRKYVNIPTYKHGPGQLRDTQNDYKEFVPKISNGLVEKGTELINNSIEAYIYSILGAQARTRQSIVSGRASALETQKLFRKIVEDSIVNYETTTWINNMNQAVSDTNVLLNTAISPTLWLIPSSMIILKNPIQGYNKKLKVSTPDMFFGVNDKLNYEEVVVKKSLEKKENNIKKSRENITITPSFSKKKKTLNENIIIFVIAIIGGILVSKHLL